ncbi:MAG: ATP-binding protein [Gammaproteobacteria bacterium]|nr:ATP-binding protein [Gammaproteobacteria bacterium]
MERRGEVMVRFLSNTLINPLYHYDMEAMYDLINNILRQENVSYIYVLDNQGQIIHDGQQQVSKFGQVLSDPVSQKANKTEHILFQRNEDFLDISMPIRLGDEVLGAVRVGLSTKQMVQNINSMDDHLRTVTRQGEDQQLKLAIVVTIIFLILGTILSLFVARKLTRPIKELSNKTKNIGFGDYGQELEIYRHDEIGELYNSFHEMINRLKETTISRDFLDNIFLSMTEALFVLRLDGTIEMVNDATSRLLHFTKEELLTMNYNAIIEKVDNEDYDFIKDVIHNETLPSIDTIYCDKEGNYIDVSFSASLMQDHKNHPRSIVVLAHDISDRKRIDRMKDEFISTVNHELRTPLTSMRASLSMLSEGVTGVLPDKTQELINIALKNSIQLNELVNDILDIQKITSGKMTYNIVRINIHDFLIDAIENSSAYAKQYGVNLNLLDTEDGDIFIDADKKRLLQVMANLISNAAKFSHKNSSVEISLQQHTDTIEISVRDYGIGIPSDFKEKVFERFTQVDSSSTRSIGGTGLGLNISKEIIESMGGSIGYESYEDNGTRFFFHLPRIIQ